MRRYVIPLLTAGAVALLAGQAMATDSVAGGSFTETHPLLTSSTPNGDHYKITDFVETGRHGADAGGFQLDSQILKNVANEVAGYKADDSWGYTTGSNPFTSGRVGGATGDTDMPLPAPAYTDPCPMWLWGVNPGSCPANTYATDPQTEDNVSTVDGTVLDDLYQKVGADDSMTVGFDQYTRTFDQWLDQLFYRGKRGTVNGGPLPTVAEGDGNGTTQVHFNIDDTLDQDIADYVHETNTGEISGIYGKLTLLFQMAAQAYDINGSSGAVGCMSGGTDGQSDNGPSLCPNSTKTGAEYAETSVSPFASFNVDQWVVSDVWDWTNAGTPGDKLQGSGMAQGYSSWFRDGSQKDWTYDYTYQGGHGAVNKSFDPGTNHQHIDP